jgi:hypothetical protein
MGFLAWIESLFSGGIRLNGPAIGPQSAPRVVASATCFGSAQSCEGFRSLEEYVAAVHASQNLGIPFDRLKSRIQSGKTLAQAIKELRPTLNGRVEAQRAEQEALKSLRSSSS